MIPERTPKKSILIVFMTDIRGSDYQIGLL